jgi:hypothetical protein
MGHTGTQLPYTPFVTLLIGMSKPEGIYLSVDYRITDISTHEFMHDKASKSLAIHYPPLNDGGPKVLLGFTGKAELSDGTPMLDWIRQTLRGESEVIDQSMAHLLRRLNRDIAPYGEQLMINLLVIERYRRLFGGFSNVRSISLPDQSPVMPGFTYMMRQLTEWTIFANGSGMGTLVKDGHLARLQPHLNVVPRKPMDHMNLLAVMNRRVAAKDETVSKFSHVSFINSGNRFGGPVSHIFTEKGESVPFEMPLILSGIDVTDGLREVQRNAQALRRGEISAISEISIEKALGQVQRRP